MSLLRFISSIWPHFPNRVNKLRPALNSVVSDFPFRREIRKFPNPISPKCFALLLHETMNVPSQKLRIHDRNSLSQLSTRNIGYKKSRTWMQRDLIREIPRSGTFDGINCQSSGKGAFCETSQRNVKSVT